MSNFLLFRRMRTVTNMYIANLAIADFILTVLAMPFQFQVRPAWTRMQSNVRAADPDSKKPKFLAKDPDLNLNIYIAHLKMLKLKINFGKLNIRSKKLHICEMVPITLIFLIRKVKKKERMYENFFIISPYNYIQ